MFKMFKIVCGIRLRIRPLTSPQNLKQRKKILATGQERILEFNV